MSNIRHFRQLEVYQLAMDASMKIFELSKMFPLEERYSLTDQMRRSSRSVCANIAEAWRKRRYPNAFVSKLSDAEACIGYDGGDAVSQEYKSPAEFKGGTIKFVAVTVEKAQYLDLETLAAGAFARD